MSNEQWRPIVGYEGLYEVSDLGRVRGLDRQHVVRVRGAITSRKIKGRVLSTFADADGYRAVRLHKAGVGRCFRVSRLVLAAFVRQPQPAEEALHIDHDCANNAVANLRWGTRQDNEGDKTKAGRRPASTRGLLTRDAVVSIRALRNLGVPPKELARLFGCCRSNIYKICNQHTWRL